MKKYILASILIIASLSGCNSFLDLNSEHQISNNSFYRDQNDFDRALLGVYSSLRGLYNGGAVHYAAELRTDNAEIHWSSPSTDEMQFEQNALTSTNNTVRGIWNTCLRTISRCNTILNRIGSIEFDEQEKNRIIGETKFLRAFSYFYLVQLFGEIPITESEFSSPEQIAETDLTRKPVDAVYGVIIDDLTQAETLLSSVLNSDKTRVSIGTVNTLLGKIYLTRGDVDAATTELEKVITSGQYGLHSNYGALFSEGNNNLEESIFEIQYVRGRELGNTYSALFTPAITSMAIFPDNLQGAGRITPSLDLFNAYEEGDKRKDFSVNDMVPLINGNSTYARYALKFVDWNAVALSDGAVTFTILRYADVLLMYAEALNKSNRTADALIEINKVRNRVGLDDLEGLNQETCALAIENERRVEFAFEGHRWFDLLRNGRTREVVNTYYTSKGLNFAVEEYELLFPIPLAEIELNDDLTQNEKY